MESGAIVVVCDRVVCWSSAFLRFILSQSVHESPGDRFLAHDPDEGTQSLEDREHHYPTPVALFCFGTPQCGKSEFDTR